MSNGDNAAVEQQVQESLYGFKIREVDKRFAEEPKRYDIKQLWDRHHEILNLNSLGHKGTDIARMLGIHPVTVSMTLNSTLGKEARKLKREKREEEFEKLEEDVLELTKKSLRVYHKILNDPALRVGRREREGKEENQMDKD